MSITEHYVTDSGTDTYANSTNSATPCSLTTALANMAAGDRFNVKLGTYSRSATDTPTPDGTATSPIIFRGYYQTPGDLDNRAPNSDGTLNTTNFPTIAYASTFKLNAAGAQFVVWENLIFTGSISGYLVSVGDESYFKNCSVTNSSTNIASGGIDGSTRSRVRISCCDVSCAATGSATSSGIRATAASSIIEHCRVTAGTGPGIITRAITRFNLVYGCSNDGIQCDSTNIPAPAIHNNTIYNCTGDGIDLVASTTIASEIAENHITDCGGAAINFNTSTVQCLPRRNRFRDNSGGTIIGGSADWASACDDNVTTDSGDNTTDFVNAAAGDFRLLTTAAGYQAGFRGRNIGAYGSASAGAVPRIGSGLIRRMSA